MALNIGKRKVQVLAHHFISSFSGHLLSTYYVQGFAQGAEESERSWTSKRSQFKGEMHI